MNIVRGMFMSFETLDSYMERNKKYNLEEAVRVSVSKRVYEYFVELNEMIYGGSCKSFNNIIDEFIHNYKEGMIDGLDEKSNIYSSYFITKQFISEDYYWQQKRAYDLKNGGEDDE